MKMPLLRTLLPLLLLALASGPVAAQKVYRWVDKNGQVHYGDSVPPEYANRDRDVINKEGLTVGHQQGEETPAEAKARQEQEKAARAAEQQAQHDRMLLGTYTSVDDIEQLRARRLDQIDSQIAIQQQSLETLKQRYAEQLKRAEFFKPRNTKPNAPEMPEGMADDLARAQSDIKTQEVNLQKRRDERVAVNKQFDKDVERYKQLRRINN